MSAASIHGVELREARFEDYQAIASLEAAQGLPTKPQDSWRRLWAGNPSYEDLGPRWPIGWVLEENGRVVGSLTNVPVAYSLCGLKLLAAAGQSWALADSHRQHSPLLLDEYLAQENADLFLTHPSTVEFSIAFAAAGALPVPAGDWNTAAYLITEPRGFVASSLRRKRIPFAGLLGHPAGLILALKEQVTARAIPRSDIDIGKARDFDQRFTPFWEMLSHRTDALISVRSRDALKWRFGGALEKNRLWIFTAARNGNLDGYAIFERCDDPANGLKRMRMADFQACDWQDQYCAAFLQRAYDDCRAEGIHVLEHIGGKMEKSRIFDQVAPHRRELPEAGPLYLTKDAELAEHLSQPQAWAPSFYDAGAICS